MGRPLRLALCVVACMAAASCASEKLLERSGPTPAWALDSPAAEEDRLLFTGQAIGANVLDEANMRSRAMADARLQIAERIATTVAADTRELLVQSGSPTLGQERTEEATYAREVRTAAAERLVGVSQEARYWEKWLMYPGFLRGAYIRYKYYVLASYPREEYERAVARYARLVSDREQARTLMQQGRPRDAAALLERLLTDYPEASVPIRLTLAEAYAQGQMLDRAAAVLRAALDLEPDRADEARIRERLQQYEQAFPDLEGAGVYVRVALSALPEEPGTVRAWVREAVARSNLSLTALRLGSGATDAADARRTGAAWLIELEPRLLATDPAVNPYGVRIEQATVECNASVLSAADGELVAATSTTERAYGRSRRSAVRAAAKAAVQSALRRCFLALVEAQAREGSP